MIKDDLIVNCRFCPEFRKTCEGAATDCLCYRCPRNLGQCLLLKYCRETESVLNGIGYDDSLDDDDFKRQLDSVLRNIDDSKEK